MMMVSLWKSTRVSMYSVSQVSSLISGRMMPYSVEEIVCKQITIPAKKYDKVLAFKPHLYKLTTVDHTCL